jgi:hypothetical protein
MLALTPNKMNRFLCILLIIYITTACIGVNNDKVSEEIGEKSKLDFFKPDLNPSSLKSQTFKINPNQDTLITTSSGMILRIFANSFLISSVDSVNQISIELFELDSKKDFAQEILTELYKNDFDRHYDISQSEKLVYLNATLNGKNLKINPSEEIGVIIPTDTIENSIHYSSPNKHPNKHISLSTVQNSHIKHLENGSRKIHFSTVSLDYPDKYVVKGDFDHHSYDWFDDHNRKIGDTLAIQTIMFDTIFAFDTSTCDVQMTYIEDFTIDSAKIFKHAKNSFVSDVIWQKWNEGYYEDYDSNYFFVLKEIGWNNLCLITTSEP